MKLWKVALLGFTAMMVNDLLMTSMVIFESRLNAPVSGLFDVAGWLTSLICSALAIEEIIKNGWRTRKSLTLIGAISIANFAGTWCGVLVGSALTHH
jgi:hypothetical protein